MAVNVEILYIPDCESTPPTRELVERVAREVEVDVELQMILVEDLEVAMLCGFAGSPTVRVNGEDIASGGGLGELSGFT